MTTHSYASEYAPGVAVDGGIKAFFEEFYRISDTQEAHEAYAEQFTPTATLFMGVRKAVGRDGMLTGV
jgi:hypothetical protein